ncbi:hypothetical protein KIH39_09770 [Telmatocola sphagniphila]|uniref:Uncharacterized protein n=1 Tax=Telmatocola sphagniphila TaxID=1123043 RepID=A0A8E6BBM7_9BACT|nr:hypothetical protein [Telmatocola sphagniphila]QVL34173.1 hypothetical protein KIH39_09770 [Telmatocola sphagniphila]
MILSSAVLSSLYSRKGTSTPLVTILGLVFGAMSFFLAREGMQKYSSSKATENKELWKEILVQNHFRFMLPNKVRPTEDTISGMEIVTYSLQPEENTIFKFAYTKDKILSELSTRSEVAVLDDVCMSFMQSLRRDIPTIREVSRKSIKLGDSPGKQLVAEYTRRQVKFLVRAYVIDKQLFVQLIGGVGMTEEHPNAIKFFESFKILDSDS